MTANRVAWGQTIFCDDLRYEVAGKRSLIGIYHSDLIINGEFPVILPKLVAFVDYFEIMGALTESLSLNIFMPHDGQIPSVSLPIPREERSPAHSVLSDSDVQSTLHVHVPAVFSPLQVNQEGLMKIRMVCGDVITKLGVLNIRKIRADEKLVDPAASHLPSVQSPPAALVS